MTANDISTVEESFVAATKRALVAGFQVVEIHMAHGYLLNEFLSPLANQRTDEYGGSLENRLRLPLRIARRVRDVWPDSLPLFVRISTTDWVDGGWDLAQSIELCRQLKGLGVDLIDCSAGGLMHSAKMPVGPGFQTPFATTIRQQTGIAVGTVGLITNPVQAEQIVATGLADVVFLARELLRNPYWPLQAAKVLGAEHVWPVQYERAKL
jgi:2,4-dienoyl-CoA reductase-like NADH-dependent reductase (Old Yellow Enzyme family)